MKTVEYEFNGQMYHLCMNGAAMFDCFDKFGSEGSIADYISGKTKETFDNTCWILAKLSEQGELVRRFEGYDKGEMLSFEQCHLMLRPADVAEAKNRIIKTLIIGFARTEEDDSEIDVGLAKLEQKKTEKSRGHNGFTRLHRFLAYLFKKVCCCFHRA